MPRAKAEAPALFEEGEIGEAPEKLLTDAVAIYNEVATNVNERAKSLQWRLAKVLPSARRKRLKNAVVDYAGIRGFRQELENAAKNDFLNGREGRTGAHKDWRPDLDFFIQPSTVVKILEGKWPPSDAQPSRIHMPKVGLSTPQQKTEAPFKHDIESPADRMAFTIERYRAAGKWADANRVEQQLSELQKRPAVLVPAPEVAGLAMPPKQPVERAQPRPAPRAAPNGSAAPGPRQAPHVTDLPGWVDEAIPDSAYGDGP